MNTEKVVVVEKVKKGMFTEIGDRMKKYETNQGPLLDDTLPYIIRLDGHTFHTFAKDFEKPFDENLDEIMVLTAQDLLLKFNAVTAYTQSDEISLIFPALKQTKEDENKTLAFGGRVLKLCTLASSYCSVRFNYHCVMNKHKWKTSVKNYDKIMARLTEGEAHFDARAFNLADDRDVHLNILWRSTFDCVRNAKSRLAWVHMSQKEMDHQSSNKLVELLKEKGIDWNAFPNSFKYGTFCKKTQVDREVFKYEGKVKTDEMTVIKKTVVKIFSFKMENSDEHKKFLFEKIVVDEEIRE